MQQSFQNSMFPGMVSKKCAQTRATIHDVITNGKRAMQTSLIFNMKCEEYHVYHVKR